MTPLLFILSFLAFAIAQSWFINGIHISMDGKEKLDCSGRWMAVGDVLYPMARRLRMGSKERMVLNVESATRAVENAANKSTKKYPFIDIHKWGSIGYIPFYIKFLNVTK